jgi:hypothetical protein
MTFQFECPNGHLLEGTPDHAEEAPAEDDGGWGVQVSGRRKAGLGDIAPKGPELLHIPCPNGHELETPPEMLDQEVLCPHCQAQFTLRRKNSVEFKRKQEEELMLKEQKIGQIWLQGAIIAVVLIVIGLGALLAIGYANRH